VDKNQLILWRAELLSRTVMARADIERSVNLMDVIDRILNELNEPSVSAEPNDAAPAQEAVAEVVTFAPEVVTSAPEVMTSAPEVVTSTFGDLLPKRGTKQRAVYDFFVDDFNQKRKKRYYSRVYVAQVLGMPILIVAGALAHLKRAGLLKHNGANGWALRFSMGLEGKTNDA